MKAISLLETGRRAYGHFTRVANLSQGLLLFGVRLYWGWQFFSTGKGKLGDLATTTEFFRSLSIPLPGLNAFMAGTTECLGGLLLLLGLGSRVVAVPLIVTMAVAYLTADREALTGIVSDPDAFVTAAPFLFLFASLLVLAFGPGPISIDYLLQRKFRKAAPPVPVPA